MNRWEEFIMLIMHPRGVGLWMLLMVTNQFLFLIMPAMVVVGWLMRVNIKMFLHSLLISQTLLLREKRRRKY